MRPPRATPKRVIIQAPEPVKKKRSRLWWPLVVLALIVLLAAGSAVGRQLVRNNYYVGDDDGRVTVLRGLPGNVFGYSLQESARVGCVTDDGKLTLVEPGNAQCRVMLVDDLWPAAREQVRVGLPSGSLDDTTAQMERLAELDLLPVCTVEEEVPATPAPPPPATEPAPPGPDGTPAPGTPPAETSPAPPETTTPENPAPGEPLPPATAAPETPPAPDTTPQIPGQNCRVGA